MTVVCDQMCARCGVKYGVKEIHIHEIATVTNPTNPNNPWLCSSCFTQWTDVFCTTFGYQKASLDKFRRLFKRFINDGGGGLGWE